MEDVRTAQISDNEDTSNSDSNRNDDRSGSSDHQNKRTRRRRRLIHRCPLNHHTTDHMCSQIPPTQAPGEAPNERLQQWRPETDSDLRTFGNILTISDDKSDDNDRHRYSDSLSVRNDVSACESLLPPVEQAHITMLLSERERRLIMSLRGAGGASVSGGGSGDYTPPPINGFLPPNIPFTTFTPPHTHTSNDFSNANNSVYLSSLSYIANAFPNSGYPFFKSSSSVSPATPLMASGTQMPPAYEPHDNIEESSDDITDLFRGSCKKFFVETLCPGAALRDVTQVVEAVNCLEQRVFTHTSGSKRDYCLQLAAKLLSIIEEIEKTVQMENLYGTRRKKR